MRARRLIVALSLTLAFAGSLPAWPAAAPARLEVRGSRLPTREVEALFAAALRSPRDTTAARSALGILVSRLQALGHLDAHAVAEWDSLTPARLLITVSEGPRYRFSRLSIEAPNAEDSALVARSLDFVPGEWASPGALRARLERAVEDLSGHGYPYAVLGVSSWQADSGSVVVRVAGAPGPPVTVTAVRIEGLKVTRRDLALRALGHITGAPFRREAAEDARDRLEALGLFRSVTWQGLEGEADWHRAHLVYRVDEPRYNEFEGALGVQGRGSAVGTIRLQLDNLVGTGRALGLQWESRGHGVSLFGARASEPQVLGLPLRLEVRADQDVQDTIFTRTRWGARAVFALSGRERLEAGFEEERVVQEQGEVEEADLQNTLFAFERSTLDAPRIGRRGLRVRVSATQVTKRERLRPPGERTARAGAPDLSLEWRRPLTEATGIRLEARAAGRFGTERVLPFYERWPLGGATTLRGYDEEQFRVDRFALTRLEWGRFLGAGSQSAYLFWDHAWMSTRLPLPAGGDGAQTLSREGFGVGLRLETAGGVVGLDYGLAPGRPPIEGKIHVQLVSQF